MDPQALTDLIDSVPALIVTRYSVLIGCVALLWDHMLTLRGEIEYIWKLPIGFSKLAFLFNRYFVEASLCFSVYILLELRGPLSQEMCRYFVFANAGASALPLAVANLVVTFHMRSLWEKRRAVTYALFFGFFIAYSATAVCVGLVTYDFQAHIIWAPEINSCIILDKPKLLMGVWVGMVAFDIFVLLMVFVNALNRPYRQNSELIRNLQRDGIKFFSTLLLVNSINLALTVFSSPVEIFIMMFFARAIVSITHSRFLLMVKAMESKTASEGGSDDSGYETATPPTDLTPTCDDSGNWSRKSELIELQAVPGWVH